MSFLARDTMSIGSLQRSDELPLISLDIRRLICSVSSESTKEKAKNRFTLQKAY